MPSYSITKKDMIHVFCKCNLIFLMLFLINNNKFIIIIQIYNDL